MAGSLTVKTNAAEILDKQLAAKAKKNQYGIITVGSGTDAYMHQEEKQEQTLSLLKVILKNRFPVFISTKCALIKKDIDLLKEIHRSAILPHDLKYLQLPKSIVQIIF